MRSTILEKLRTELESDKGLTQLSFDELHIKEFTPELKQEVQKATELRRLHLNLCKLESLRNFPQLAKLTALELNDNKVGHQLGELSHLKSLRTLQLSNCGVKDFAQLDALKDLPLRSLDLENNSVAQKPGYRKKVFQLIPSLEVLDSKNREGKYVEEQLDSDSEEEEDEDDEEVSSLIDEGESSEENQSSPQKVKK